MFSVRPTVAAGLACAILIPAHSGVGADPLEITVRPKVATEPGFVRVTARVERHAENRWLVVEAEGPTFFRSSQRQLDGEYAARTHVVEFTTLPPGDYKIRVRVGGVGDQIRAAEWRDFKVLGEVR